MSTAFVEGLFLLALWTPPLVVAACALLLLIPNDVERRVAAPRHAAPVAH